MKRTLSGLVLAAGVLFATFPAFAGFPCVLTCPSNITDSNDPNQCGGVVTYPAPTTNGGNCGLVTTDIPSGSFFPVGTTTVIATSQDLATCSFNITVNDTQPPSIVCPTNIDQTVDAASAVEFTPGGSDNCPSFTTDCNPDSGSVFPIGDTTTNCTHTDASLNTATCAFLVRLTLTADLSLGKSDLPDPVLAGGNLTYTMPFANNGPNDATNVTLTDTIPAGTTFVSMTAPAGWLSTVPTIGGTGTITSDKATVTNGETGTFTLVVKVDEGTTDGTVITNTASILAASPEDIHPDNNTATTTTSVGLPQIGVNDASVTEGDEGTVDACFAVSLSKPSTDVVTVDFATADDTAMAQDDYAANTGTTTFAAGDTEENICVTVNSDLATEFDEIFLVNLSNPTNAVIGDGEGQGTIVDDDEAPATTGGETGGDEGGCSLIF